MDGVAALILFGCRQLERVGAPGSRGMALRWVLLLPVLLFSVSAQHDFVQNRGAEATVGRWARMP